MATREGQRRQRGAGREECAGRTSLHGQETVRRASQAVDARRNAGDVPMATSRAAGRKTPSPLTTAAALARRTPATGRVGGVGAHVLRGKSAGHRAQVPGGPGAHSLPLHSPPPPQGRHTPRRDRQAAGAVQSSNGPGKKGKSDSPPPPTLALQPVRRALGGSGNDGQMACFRGPVDNDARSSRTAAHSPATT